MKDSVEKNDPKKSVILLLVSLGFIALLGVADVLVSRDINLALFYLIPLSIGAWKGPRWLIITLIIAGACGLGIADFLSRDPDVLPWISLANDLTSLVFISLSTVLIRKVRLSHLAERALARTDALTGAANFRQFRETASAELERAKRHGYPTTMVYFDLDGFKGVNDTLGHDVGDQVLIELVKYLKAEIRTTDLAVRFGGDEFGILMPQAEFSGAHTRLEQLRAGMGRLMESRRWPVSVSMGAVTWLKTPDSLEVFLTRADEMMYEAKNAGKDQLVHIRIS